MSTRKRNTLDLGLPELGAAGRYQVLAVEACPEIEAGPGRVVTGVFRFGRGEVYELLVGGEAVGMTARHPVWSVDREDWIQAFELCRGERVLIGNGVAIVEAWAFSGREPVYNLEVDGDHCYRVGEQGILVHNASTPSYGPTKTIAFMNGNKQVTAIVGTSASITLDSTNVGGIRKPLTEPNWWPDLEAVAGSPIQLGHILGSQIGGKEPGAKNLTPLYAKANSPAMRTCEGFLRSLIDKCNYCTVEVVITVNNYGGNEHVLTDAKPVMPASVTINWVVDDKIKGVFVVNNDPAAITEGPCRAASLPCRQ